MIKKVSRKIKVEYWLINQIYSRYTSGQKQWQKQQQKTPEKLNHFFYYYHTF